MSTDAKEQETILAEIDLMRGGTARSHAPVERIWDAPGAKP